MMVTVMATSLLRIAGWFGVFIVLYVIAVGFLIEHGGDYYSFSAPKGRKRLLLHAIIAMPILLLFAELTSRLTGH
jgi:hypothetical protein